MTSRTIIVPVTADHLNRGHYADPQNCPLAIAIGDRLRDDNESVAVYYDHIAIRYSPDGGGPTCYNYRTSPALRDWLLKSDYYAAERSNEPFDLRLELPDPDQTENGRCYAAAPGAGP